MTRNPYVLLNVAAALALAACTGGEGTPGQASHGNLAPALESITVEELLHHTSFLASDELEGRAPGTPGEDRTVAYLVEQFTALGLRPGNPDGTYVQNVPLVGLTPEVNTASFTVGDQVTELHGPDDYLAVAGSVTPEARVDGSDVVFVGYGVQAPEYGWDDFKDTDVTGKTVLMLVGDPPVPDPDNAERLDPGTFNGEAMTYYGRWTYKYEIAAAKGAAAAIIVHETGPAGYPFAVLQADWGQEYFDVDSDGDGESTAVEAWIPVETARKLFRSAGYDFDRMKQAALQADFRPLDLGVSASFHLANSIRRVESRNIIAMVQGSDPELRDEFVVYTAHWDHLGKNETVEGDQIFNGALDNASGTAALLELAGAFATLSPPPARSVLFLAVTAEEQGLLGARYYAENPLYPLTRTLANINIDGVNQWGRTRDIVVIGLGNSTLDDVLGEAVAAAGRTVAPDPEPEKGFYYRSDHFEFAKQGVPALYVDSGTEYVDRPEGWGESKRAEYTERDYHKPSDEVKPDWDLSGAVADTRILFEVGYRVAQAGRYPEWKQGTEFRAIREEMLQGGR